MRYERPDGVPSSRRQRIAENAWFRLNSSRLGKLVRGPVRGRLRQFLGRLAAEDRPRVVQVGDTPLHVPRDVAPGYAHCEFEPRTMRWIHEHLSEGDVAVDVGANVGVVTLQMAAAVGRAGKVVAIEPLPVNFDCLRRNVDAHANENVEVVRIACGCTRKTIDLHVGASTAEASVYRDRSGTERTMTSNQAPLDDLVSGRVDMVKMDVEGAELDVLGGMTRILDANPHLRLVVEFNPLALERAGRRPLELYQFISANGFSIQLLDDGDFRDDSRPLVSVHDALRARAAGYLPERWYGNLVCTRTTRTPA